VSRLPELPSSSQAIKIRAARREERWLIIRRIFREGLDPTKLDWRRFVVAEGTDSAILGFAQMKDLGGGVQEFGSLVVEPHVRGQGIGRALLAHLIKVTPTPIYLLCAGKNVAYYRQFGFREIHADEMPVPLRRKWRTGNFFARMAGHSVAAMVLSSMEAFLPDSPGIM
jgi:N-acetylglutamate synthase-like GNAT family acetyltransferase